jgi:hypothetical protein
MPSPQIKLLGYSQTSFEKINSPMDILQTVLLHLTALQLVLMLNHMTFGLIRLNLNKSKEQNELFEEIIPQAHKI